MPLCGELMKKSRHQISDLNIQVTRFLQIFPAVCLNSNQVLSGSEMDAVNLIYKLQDSWKYSQFFGFKPGASWVWDGCCKICHTSLKLIILHCALETNYLWSSVASHLRSSFWLNCKPAFFLLVLLLCCCTATTTTTTMTTTTTAPCLLLLHYCNNRHYYPDSPLLLMLTWIYVKK